MRLIMEREFPKKILAFAHSLAFHCRKSVFPSSSHITIYYSLGRFEVDGIRTLEVVTKRALKESVRTTVIHHWPYRKGKARKEKRKTRVDRLWFLYNNTWENHCSIWYLCTQFCLGIIKCTLGTCRDIKPLAEINWMNRFLVHSFYSRP